QTAEALRLVRASAFNPNLFSGIAVIYAKGCLLAALTLFVSTFATSTIFTTIVMAFIYFIGHLQAIAREYWLQTNAAGLLTKTFLAVVALVFPDLQLFNLTDDVVAGNAVPLALGGRALHPGPCRLGTHRMGSRPFLVPAGHDVAAAHHFVLGHGRVAHGLERKHGGVERSSSTAPGPSHQSGARIFRPRQG